MGTDCFWLQRDEWWVDAAGLLVLLFSPMIAIAMYNKFKKTRTVFEPGRFMLFIL